MRIGSLVTAEGSKTTVLWDNPPDDPRNGLIAEWVSDLYPGAFAIVVECRGQGTEAVVRVLDTRGNFGWNWETMFVAV